MTIKLLTIVGARPQFIKAAAVSRAIGETDGLSEVMVHTGQHFDPNMSAVFFEELGIPVPQHHLGINGGGHGEMTGRMLMAIEPVVEAERPDWVVVYGDTNSTLAGSLVASKLHVPLAHVEAGLRSFNRRMPEEVNRIVSDHLATLNFCPTSAAVSNLAAEGIVNGVRNVGDVMYDATLFAIENSTKCPDPVAFLGLAPKGYALATIHRAENTDDPVQLRKVMQFLQERARRHPVVLPLHPRTRQSTLRFGIELTDLRVIEPVGYFQMSQLLHAAREVYTDSGGVQKEAYFHRVPCVTLRDETEWTETISYGWNRLWSGPDYVSRREIPEYGDGCAAFKIVDLLRAA